jgi:hypothetical protein
MRRADIVALALGGLFLGQATALASDSGPVIVLPGRHGLPVIINGVDATGALVEGDWGLYKPNIVQITIIPRWIPGPGYYGIYNQDRYRQDGYFPATGHEPGYGRHEIEPPANRRLPPPAPSYHRSWSSHSDPVPASVDPPVQLNVSPEIYPNGHRRKEASSRRQ